MIFKEALASGSIAVKTLSAVIILSFGLYTIFIISHRSEHINTQSLDSERLLQAQSEIVSNYYRELVYDVKFLAGLSSLHNMIETGLGKNDLQQDLLNFSENKRVFDQVRYIDQTGMEIVRVNLVDGKPVLVSEEQMQDKSNRYYFSETVKLHEGQVYISLFDLNVENERIEKPLKPMIRIGSPVYNEGEVKGAVVLNFLGHNLIDIFENLTLNNPGSFFLANENGDWLYRDDPDKEWGFMFPDREAVSFSIECPQVWEYMQNNDFYQVYKNRVLVSALKINPYEELDFIYNSENSWFLINYITAKEFGLGLKDFQYRYTILAIIILFLDIVGALLISRIIIQRNKYRKSMEHAALYDNLTDLPNRNLIYDRITKQLELADRYKLKMAVCFIDLDGFKSVNDQFGHDVGDSLLQTVGLKMKAVLRSSDTVGRYGGDEFIVLLPRVSSEEECDVVTKKILNAIDEKLIIEGHEINIGASIGISIVEGGNHENLEQILHEADTAMYRVKKSGKNAIAYFTD